MNKKFKNKNIKKSVWETEDLILKNITKTYSDGHGGKLKAIDNMSLTINKGEFTTLLGPSGCGKTTTLRVVAGFESIDSGELYMGKRCINTVPAFERNMPMVFQSYALFPHLSIYDNIAYGLKIQKTHKNIIRNDVEMILQLLNLVGLENRFPGEISGGQQQRVALARALVLKPKIILFDEPLSNLDAKLRIQTRMEIKRVQNMLGITTLYVTHDQGEALSLSDKIVVMNKGKIEQMGTPLEIYNRPCSVFIADFIGNSNFIEAIVKEANSKELILDIQDKLLIVAKENAFPNMREKEKVYLVVKPEAINLKKRNSSEENAFIGKINNSFFLGSSMEYEIEFNNTIITSIQQNTDGFPLFLKNGELVSISFNQNCIQILEKD